MNKKVVAEVIGDKLILTYKPYYGTDFIEKSFLDGNTEILLFHRCVSVGKTDMINLDDESFSFSIAILEGDYFKVKSNIDAYQGSDLKPIFESSVKYFFVTLPNLNYKQPDQINDQINDLALLILRVVKGKPGLNVPQILDEIKPEMPDVNADRIRNELRRNLTKFIEHRGPNKTGGYYMKYSN